MREGVKTSPRCTISPTSTSIAGTSATARTAPAEISARDRTAAPPFSGTDPASSRLRAVASHGGTRTASPKVRDPKNPR